MRPDQDLPRSAPDDPELDGIVRLATHIGGAPAFVSLGARGAAGPATSTRSWSLRGVDGEVRGWLTVGSAMLDPWQREALDLVAVQAGALLERRDREAELLATIAELLRSDEIGAVEVPALLAAVRADLAEDLTARAARVTYDGPGTLRTDATLLHRLVRNLVANALEHSCDGVAPVVRVRARTDQHGWWLEVADNGPGIPAEARERVFDPFVRLADEPGAGAALSGSSLATCARIAESLGGRITADAAEGGGAVFRVTVPSS